MLYRKENIRVILTDCSFKAILQLFFISVFLIVLSNNLHAQFNTDSIKALSFEEFDRYFNKEKQVDSLKNLIYTNAYLEKARKNIDTVRMADAYYKLSLLKRGEEALQYADSIIFISNELKRHNTFPALGYLMKGNAYFNLGELQKASDQYILAQKYTEKNKNETMYAGVKLCIGLIKNNLGEKEDALQIFKEYINYVQKSKIPNKKRMLTTGLFALADAYTAVEEYDTAKMVIKEGMKTALQLNSVELYADFLNSYGINLFFLQDYYGAIDTIQKAIELVDLEQNISFAYLYLGKSKLALGDTIEALDYFNKVDSFISTNNFITQELLEGYPPIIEYYKRNKDYVNQLFYTNQLIKFDSIFDATKIAVSRNIAKKYEIPLLLASKEKLIDELNKAQYLSVFRIYLLLTISFLLITTVIYFILRNRTYKKRFYKLMNLLNEKETNQGFESIKHNIEETKTEANKPALDNKLVNSILYKLDKFENSTRFTKNGYTLDKLAKELKTNKTYLSKIINDYKGESFSNYLKNIRLDFAISCLKKDVKFRTYTIQAIAEEVGFNKAQSFSTAFHKKTGLYPSYFIKQLEKKQID